MTILGSKWPFEPATAATAASGNEGREMASVVNLNRFRKAKKHAEDERQAAENRAAFGRSKSERQRAEADEARRRRELDGKQID
jgi:hypothetical protein